MWDRLKRLRNQYFDLGIGDVINYERFAMISIIYHSTKIEGCSLDESDTSILLQNDLTAKGKPLRDHMMVKDHHTAFLYLKNQARQQKPITVNLIKEVGGLVMKQTGGIVKTALGDFDSSKGDLRLVSVKTDRRYFPTYSTVPGLLENLCRKVNEQLSSVSETEVVKLSADIHYHLVAIHPFVDGNGRAARLMMNYVQMYHKEPLIKIFSEDRKEYLEALRQADKGEMEAFRSFVCSQQIKFLETEIREFQKSLVN